MIVLAIDPGSSQAQVSHTGIVLLSGTTLLDSWAVDGGVTGFRKWYERFASPTQIFRGEGWTKFDAVVCEQFVDRQVMGADRSPLKIEGVVQFLWPDVVLQPTSGYKSQMPDEIMEKLGFSSKSFGGDHHKDRWAALRHGLLYMKRQLVPEVLAAFR